MATADAQPAIPPRAWWARGGQESPAEARTASARWTVVLSACFDFREERVVQRPWEGRASGRRQGHIHALSRLGAQDGV